MSATVLRPTAVSGRLAWFATIGTASTVLYWTLFLVLQPAITATWATLAALVISTVLNTAAQRYFTFGASGATSARRDHMMSLVAFGGSWLLSLWGLELLASFAPNSDAIAQLAIAQACTLVGSAVRFSLLNTWHR